jgi:hypothetical protein
MAYDRDRNRKANTESELLASCDDNAGKRRSWASIGSMPARRAQID